MQMAALTDVVLDVCELDAIIYSDHIIGRRR